MAKSQPVKLSDLRPGVEYPVTGAQEPPERRCLFHVKLTDFSMRSIESLLNSDKDACFSLWFVDGGGSISIPGSKEYRKFNFKTSQGDIDGLECVHQAVDTTRQPRLSCWGQIRYKLQVQGTKEVYERTKKLMKETEEQKQKTRTQTINFPHTKGRSKSGGHHPGRPTGGGRPLSKTSSPFSSISGSHFSHSFSNSSAPPPPVSSSSSSSAVGGTISSFSSKFSTAMSSSPSLAASGGAPPTASSGPPASGGSAGGSSSSSQASHVTVTPASNGGGVSSGSGGGVASSGLGKSSGGRKSSKTPHTLKERIIHLLAVKPQRRSDIINRLKKETKRGETAMTKTDSLLQEVADLQGDVYCLKHSLYSELRVDDWPFYSEAERQLVKRKHGGSSEEFLKRVPTGRDPPPAKRQKFSHGPSSTPPQSHTLTHSSKKHSPPPPFSKSFTTPSNNSHTLHLNMPQLGIDSSNTVNSSSNIEIQASTQAVSAQLSNQSSLSTRPATQYPASVFSSYVRASSSSLPPPFSSSSSVSAVSHSSLHTSSSLSSSSQEPPLQQQQQQQHHHQQQQQVFSQGQPTGLTSLSTGQTSLTAQPPTDRQEVGVVAPPTGGHGQLFGDLVAAEGAEVPVEVAGGTGESMGKKKKKKKSKNRDKPAPKLASDSTELKAKPDEEEKGAATVKVKNLEGELRERVGESKVKTDAAPEENGASSTTPSSGDLSLMFPPITSDAKRAEYKKIFNEEYQEYLSLKSQVEVVHKEVTALGHQMAAVKKGTEEARILKRKIRAKYTELELNVKYQGQKKRFHELHLKLEHIKKLVVAYDQSH